MVLFLVHFDLIVGDSLEDVTIKDLFTDCHDHFESSGSHIMSCPIPPWPKFVGGFVSATGPWRLVSNMSSMVSRAAGVLASHVGLYDMN